MNVPPVAALALGSRGEAGEGIGKAIARRIAIERRMVAYLNVFTRDLFDAAEALADEVRAREIPERIVLLTQPNVAVLPDHAVAHGALYVFVVSETNGLGVPAERFLVSGSDDVHCDGVCAPAGRDAPIATVRRLLEAIWADGRKYWTPFDSIGPVTAAIAEPHPHGQLGFRPRVRD
jgi:NAD(P)-dependent dehydrogenase (short-subunit alcohol dehydrogenase family)